MISISSKEDCCGCHACQAACPQAGCIEMLADNEGFLYPHVNKQICTECGACEEVCPMRAHSASPSAPPVAYAAWNCNDAVRAESSSGGVFSLLMNETLSSGGVVFGAAFDSDMSLQHRSAKNEADSIGFRGSKYVQSIIGDCYREVELYVGQGLRVLFSGTPCQVAGLYSYLGKEYENLLTCDLVCHGVPSKKVFDAYIKDLEQRKGAKIVAISFRRKDRGWKNFSVALSFYDGTDDSRIFMEDPFMLGFLRNIYLRPSCYKCRFSRIPRVADISLADFWGINKCHPEWDDDKGTSLVLIQTEKGWDAVNECREHLMIYEADLKMAISSNPCICGSVEQGGDRTSFFSDLDSLSFEKIIKKYLSPPSLLNKILSLAFRSGRFFLRLWSKWLIPHFKKCIFF